jgi:hypothetical protein
MAFMAKVGVFFGIDKTKININIEVQNNDEIFIKKLFFCNFILNNIIEGIIVKNKKYKNNL